MSYLIQSNRVFNAVSVAASGSFTSQSYQGVELQAGTVGYFAADIVISGSGTATIGIQCSVDGINWRTVSSQSAIGTANTVATGLTASAAPGSTGNYYFQIKNLPTAKYVRFYITETGGANSVTVTFDLVFQ